MSVKPAAANSADNPANVVMPSWEIDASAHLPAQERSLFPRVDLVTQQTMLQPLWDIDAVLPSAGRGEIAVAVTIRAAALDISELSALFHAFNAGEKSLGGQGISLECGLSQVDDRGAVLVLRPLDSKGANARLQSLIEPLGGAGTIAAWDVPACGASVLIHELVRELSGTPPANVRSVASFGDAIQARVVVL